MGEMSVISWLACKIDQLETAGLMRDEVAIALTEYQERKLKEELQALTFYVPCSVHHSEYYGWRLIVKGDNS
jgi:hypothetical protein